MTDDRQIVEVRSNQISTKRGFPVYRTNPSVPTSKGLPTRSRRFEVPGGKAAMIVDNSTGEIKGLGDMGFSWEEEVDTTRFVKLFLDGIKQAAGLSKTGIQVWNSPTTLSMSPVHRFAFRRDSATQTASAPWNGTGGA